MQSELISQSVSGSKWVVLLEGWDVKRDTRDVKGPSLLLNLGTCGMFFSSGFALLFFFFSLFFLVFVFLFFLLPFTSYFYLFFFFLLHVVSVHTTYSEYYNILPKLSALRLLTELDELGFCISFFLIVLPLSGFPLLLNSFSLTCLLNIAVT